MWFGPFGFFGSAFGSCAEDEDGHLIPTSHRRGVEVVVTCCLQPSPSVGCPVSLSRKAHRMEWLDGGVLASGSSRTRTSAMSALAPRFVVMAVGLCGQEGRHFESKQKSRFHEFLISCLGRRGLLLG